MFGRANNPSWPLGVAAAAAVTLALPSSGGAHGPNRAARLRAQDAALEAKTRSSVLVLYSLDARLGAAQASLATLEWRMGRLEARQRAIRFELRLAAIDSRLSEDRVASRLRYLYDYGTNTSSLDIVLGSSSISQALNRLDDANEVAAANADVIAELHASQNRLSALSNALTGERRRLAQTAADLTASVTTLGQARAQRSGYISSLEQTRADNAAQIAQLDAQAQAAEARAQALMREHAQAVTPPQPSTVSEPVSSVSGGAAVAPAGFAGAVAAPAATSGPAATAPLGSRALTVVATGYALSGRTSTGIPVGYGVVAVDPSVIPLGSHMTVPGYGFAVAADTGGAIIGDRIDLWFPTMAEADAWGVRTVTVVVDG